MLKQLGILGALALVSGVAVRLLVPPAAAGSLFPALTFRFAAATTAARPVAWEPVWSADAPGLADLALSPDGGSAAWVDGNGVVRRLSGETGGTLWETPAYPGMNRVRINRDGMVITYAADRDGRNAVRLLDPRRGAGRSALALVDGAITSAEITPNGERVLIGVSTGRAYAVPMISSRVYSGLPVQLPGEPAVLTSFSDAGNAPHALCGTRDGALLTWEAQKEGVTPVPLSPANGQPVSHVVSSIDRTLTAVAYAPTANRPARLELWDHATRKRLWSAEIAGTPYGLRMSRNANVIAVNFTRGAGDRAERKVTVFDRDGKRLFGERGGLSFSPDVIAVSPSGDCLTVRDAGGTLWLLDGGGHTVGRLRAPADAAGRPLRLSRALSTPDGGFLLLHCTGAEGAGHLLLYRFRQPVATVAPTATPTTTDATPAATP